MKRALAIILVLSGSAAADSTSGVDGALFRSSYDANGIFAVEGARLMPKRDLSLKILGGYAKSPVAVPVPGNGDDGDDPIHKYVATLDLALGMTLTDRVAIGISAAAYRAKTDDGYGKRGRYMPGGGIAMPSTGLIALRPLSNIDPSASPSNDSAYLGDGLAGPLDVRLGAKYSLMQTKRMALAAIANVTLLGTMTCA